MTLADGASPAETVIPAKAGIQARIALGLRCWRKFHHRHSSESWNPSCCRCSMCGRKSKMGSSFRWNGGAGKVFSLDPGLRRDDGLWSASAA